MKNLYKRFQDWKLKKVREALEENQRDLDKSIYFIGNVLAQSVRHYAFKENTRLVKGRIKLLTKESKLLGYL